MVADVVVCVGADVVVGGLDGGATVDAFGAGAGALERTGAGAEDWLPVVAGGVVPGEPAVLLADPVAPLLASPEDRGAAADEDCAATAA